MDPERLSEIIAAISADPEAVDTLAADELAATRDQLIETIRELRDGLGESADRDADLATAREARDRIDRIDARLASLAEAETAAAEEMAGLIDGLEPEETTDSTESTETPEEGATEEVEAPTAETEQEEEVDESLAAGGRPSIGQLARHRPAARAPQPQPQRALVAAGSIGGIREGDEVTDRRQVAQLMIDRWAELGHLRPRDRQFYPVARFSHRGEYDIGPGDSDDQVMATIMAAAERAQRTGVDELASLTASGGFCAPADVVYGFYSIMATDGLLQIPTVTSRRGQIQYPVSPSWRTYEGASGIGDQYTEANDIAEVEKDVYEATCPETGTFAVDAHTTILKTGNFKARFYPEFVDRVAADALIKHRHRVNEDLISALVGSGITVTHNVADNGGGTWVNWSQALLFHASLYRNQFRTGMDMPLVVVAPTWIRDALDSDYIARASVTDLARARAYRQAWHAEHGFRVQWVYDWQDLDLDVGGGVAAGNFPDAGQAMMYAEGTFVRLDGGSLNLGVVRDSTLNATNDFENFSETFEGVAEVGHECKLLDFAAGLCPTGVAGAADAISCATGS